MNTFILLNFARGLSTSFLLYVLLFILAQPKYGRKVNTFIVILLVTIGGESIFGFTEPLILRI